MSEPTAPAERDGAPAAAGEAPSPPRRPRRLIDTLTFMLLCAALAVVAVSLAPEALRAAGVVGPHHEAPFQRGGRLSLGPHGGEPPVHPLFAPGAEDEDDEPHVTELERLYPDGMWPGRRAPEERRRDRELFPKPRDGRPEADQDAPRVHDPTSLSPGAGETRARFGVARSRIRLIGKPGEGGRALGYVEPGKLVMVIKEVGDYALVAYTGDDGVLMGWTKKSEIAVR